MVSIHMSFPKNSILKQIENMSDSNKLKQLSHEELVLEYCERLVAQIVKDDKSFKR